MREDVTMTKNAPPTFLVCAWDDPVTVFSSLCIATELTKVAVPAELHIYATGGHGYGMRDTGEPVNSWRTSARRLARPHSGWLKQDKINTKKWRAAQMTRIRADNYGRGQLSDPRLSAVQTFYFFAAGEDFIRRVE